RVLRYDWFDSLLEEQKLHYMLTAHHLDDQLETFLINLTRGTGLEGLGGIPARTPKILRPLLIFTRKQIRAYAQARGLVWRDDSSNLEDKYLRNRLRQEVIPALKKTDPRFEANFLKTLGYLRGSQVLIQNHLADVKSNLFTTEDTHWRIPVDGLRKLEPLAAYLHALFREYGFTDWDAMENLLNSSSGKVLYSPTHRLLRDRESLLLKQREKPDSGIYEIDLAASGTVAPVWLVVTEVLELGECLPHVLYIDKETLKKGLQVRRWRKGDYFYPLGMKGKQKVSKYFKDHKFSQFEKESQWLLCSGEEIVWIVGHRADDRFKVRNGTKHILRIEWKESGAA
ncbi:MAG: tRNA lysidine(34) synthetase TilS, partial [Robiginitalea sp.]